MNGAPVSLYTERGVARNYLLIVLKIHTATLGKISLDYISSQINESEDTKFLSSSKPAYFHFKPESYIFSYTVLAVIWFEKIVLIVFFFSILSLHF